MPDLSQPVHYAIDETHDPLLRSWVDAALPGKSAFPIQNLPFGVFTWRGSASPPRLGVRIGDSILDLQAVEGSYLDVSHESGIALSSSTLNAVMALPFSTRRRLRKRLSELLRAGSPDEGARKAAAAQALVPLEQAEMHMPAAIGTFVDFYACLNHVTTASAVLRRGEPGPLLPNWTWMPLGYHGRGASVQSGGAPIRRPAGQQRPDRSAPPVFGPTQELDYEVEIGAFVGPGCAAGQRVALKDAASHIAGYVLVNDWSARDLQAWEGGPLGPLQSKSFATSISPWVITSEALAPFRAPTYVRAPDDPEPLPYLDAAEDRMLGGLDVIIEAYLRTARMRNAGQPAILISRANAKELYWTMQQMLVHLASNGCGVSSGDLLASGTISGPADGTRGCLLETTQRGRVPLAVGDEIRGFLENGDEVTLTAHCERDGFVGIGFGECSSTVWAMEA